MGAPNPGLVIDGITIPEPESDPVTADCGTGPLTVLQGSSGSRTVTATDPDGTVVVAGDHQRAVAGITHRRDHAGRQRRRHRQRHRLGGRHHGAGHLPGRDHGQQRRRRAADRRLHADRHASRQVRTIGEVQGSDGDAAERPDHRSPSPQPAATPAASRCSSAAWSPSACASRPPPAARTGASACRAASATRTATRTRQDGIFVFIGGFPTVLRLDGGAGLLSRWWATRSCCAAT